MLTHHWLLRRRGGEKVLEALGELVPGAPLYTLIYDRDHGGGPWQTVRTSWLQHLPGARRHHQRLFPLMPTAARSTRLPAVDLVLCSDAALAKAMRPHQRSVVVCYCHSPMRYVWEPDVQHDYLRALPAALRPAFRMACAHARHVDARAAERVDRFVANSQHVAGRIRRHYGRDSVVVYPPVDVPPEPPAPRPAEDFLLAVGHHVPYKRLDLAVAAAAAVGRRLVVIGDGPDAKRLRRAEARHVHWMGWQPDEVLIDHYARAAALVFCGQEDFGIVPVEAQAYGCPVVAYGRGGAVETVIDGKTGVLFAEQTLDAIVDALRRCARTAFDPQFMYAHATTFARDRFLREMHTVVSKTLTPSTKN